MNNLKMIGGGNKKQGTPLSISTKSSLVFTINKRSYTSKKNREKYNVCCKAMISSCMACVEGISEKEFCKKNENKKVSGCEKYNEVCCKAMTSSCMACKEGITEKAFCKKNPHVFGCKKYK